MSVAAPLVIHIFWPLSVYSRPSADLTAREAMPSTSVPAPGSDMAMPHSASPLQARGR